jgi:NitT/TauT family transport system substrate-binding protein
MDRVKSSGRDAMTDAAAPQTESEQLRAGDDPVLAARESRQPGLVESRLRFCIYVAPKCSLDRHAPILPTRACRITTSPHQQCAGTRAADRYRGPERPGTEETHMPRLRIQPHVRLQEWVAEDEGFFREEGLDYEFDPEGFAGGTVYADATVQPGDAAPMAVRSGAFEDMQEGRSCDVSGACHWAVNHAATAQHGKMWGKAYSVCVSGIFVAPDAPYARPEDLAGAKVGVGYHSGSHYSAIQGLEPFLHRAEITLDFVGRPWDRVRLMRDGRIEAANVFGAQYYLLEQQGFRKLVDTTFIMGFLVSEAAEADDLERYFRAMRHAQREIDLDADRYKHYWLREMPDDLRDTVDVRRFGPGERIVFEPYTRDMFERTHRWMRSWQLFDAESVARLAYEDAVLA